MVLIFEDTFLSNFITNRNLGGGCKRLYRKIDFKRNKLGVFAKVASIEYDPNRNARIALLNYLDGERRYILQPKDLSLGDLVLSNFDANIAIGNSLPLQFIPVGTIVHNVEFQFVL